MRILIIEDEEKTARFLAKGLKEHGHAADLAATGPDGLRLASSHSYDVIILDVMLPGMDGWTVLELMRRKGLQTPVLYLTAKDAVAQRVKGLELGADDYLVKPFAFSELLARIHTVLRRGQSVAPDILRIADLELDPKGMRATRAGKRLDLTAKEFMLLSLLMRRRGETMSRVSIAERIWNIEFEGESNVVDVHIRRLRAKVDDPFELKLIHTVRGFGYVLDER
jgi:two-component system copper resistance phosphate regulon response regulator CusR